MNIISELSLFDWLVFGALQFLTLVIILWGNKKKKKVSSSPGGGALEYLLMSRQLSLPLFVATLVATWYGGIFGVTALAYKKGIYNFITQGFFWYLTYILFAFWLAPKLNRSQAKTLPELIARAFGPRSAKIAAILNLFNIIPIAYTISIGVLIQAISGLPLISSMIIGILFVCLYSAWGGFRSVVLSDLIQFFIMIAAVIWVVILSVSQYGFTDYLQTHLTSDHLSLTGGEKISTLLVWGFIALSTLIDPNFYQRCFAAKDEKVAKKGILMATGVWFIFDICTTLGGLYAYSWSQSLEPNQAYMQYALSILPTIGKGVFLAGITATILSTLDSYLFLSSITLVHDLIKPKRYTALKHSLGVLLIGLISILLAQFFEGSIASVWKLLGSLSSAALLLPTLSYYLIPKSIKITDKQFVISSFMASTTVITSHILSKYYHADMIDPFYTGITVCIISLSCSVLYNLRHYEYKKN